MKIIEIIFQVSLAKIAAIFLSFSLILSESALYALPIPAKPITVSVPDELGTIEETFSPPPATQAARPKTVIYIQDAHDSLEAQKNIAKLIQHLVKQYGVKTVYEEGYEGLVPTDDYFGFIRDPTIKQKVSYFLMDKLRIGGAEYAHINRRKDFKLIGADNIRLHLENIAGYRQSAIYNEETAKDLAALENEMEKLANRYFSKALKDWLKLKQHWDEKKLGLLEYLKRVMPVLNRASWVRYPNMYRLLASENSKDPLIIEKAKTLDSKVLFQEINALENHFAARFLKTEKNKKIYFFLKSLGLLKRLNDLSVTSAEYEAVNSLLAKFKTRALARFIAGQTKRSVVLSKRWEKNVRFAMRFYDMARSRDEAVEACLDDFILHSDEPISALVFGGFHGDRIKEFLKKRSISYVVISPKIREIDLKHQEYYKRLMSVGYHSFETPLLLAAASRPQPIFSLPNGRAEVWKIYSSFRGLKKAKRRSEVRNLTLPAQSTAEFEERTLRANDYPDLYRGVQALFERQWQSVHLENGEWKGFFRIIENGSFIRYGVFASGQSAPQFYLGDIPETSAQRAELIAIENPGRSQRPGQVMATPVRVRANDPGSMKLVPEVVKNDFSDQYWLEWEGLRGRKWWVLYNPYAIFPPKQNAGADEQPYHLTLTRGDGRIYQSRIYQENYLQDILTFWTSLNESSSLQGKKKFRMGINGWYASRRRKAPKAGASQSQIHAQLARFVFPIERAALARKHIIGPVLVSSLNDGWGTGIVFESSSKNKNMIAHLASQSVKKIIQKGNSFNVIGIPGDRDQIKVFVIDRPLNTAPPFTNELGYSEISRAFIGGSGLATPTFREDAIAALKKVTAPQAEIDSIIQSLTLPLEPVSVRSEVRIAASTSAKMNMQVLENLQTDVVFVIKEDELARLSKRQWTELLGLKALNKDKLHIQVLAGPKTGMSERFFALQPFSNVYYGAWNPRLPRQAMAIHFSQIDDRMYAGQRLDPEVAKRINEHFGIFDGAFGTALLYAYHEGNLEGLAAKNGYRYDPNDVYASRILTELLRNYEIISTAA